MFLRVTVDNCTVAIAYRIIHDSVALQKHRPDMCLTRPLMAGHQAGTTTSSLWATSAWWEEGSRRTGLTPALKYVRTLTLTLTLTLTPAPKNVRPVAMVKG